LACSLKAELQTLSPGRNAMNLMRIAHVPPAAVELSGSVADAVRAMVDNGVGAVAVVDLGILKGIFS